MIKEVVKDQFILSQKSIGATKEDIYIKDDLIDTMKQYENCYGVAANIIGVLKRIIAIRKVDTDEYMVMFNPRILSTSGHVFEADEACICHKHTHTAKRYPQIKIEYLDENWKKKIKTFKGLDAQVVQHELDHLDGILV